MGATGTKIDRTAAVGTQTLETLRQLLTELGGARGLGELAARGTAAHLERELGLGSLERVELMLRLGDACGVRLPDRVVAEVDSVQDLVDAILRADAGGDGNGADAHGATAVAALPNSATTSSVLISSSTASAAAASPAIRPDIDE